MPKRSWFGLAFAMTIGSPRPVQGQDPGASAPPAQRPSSSPPYSLPWQLRPAAAGTAIRSDTTIAFAEPRTTVATMLLASYRVVPVLAPMVRVGFVSNHPDEGASGQSFVNPVLGVTYAPKLPAPLRLALFFGVALPLGTGGGRDPDPEVVQANAPAGVLARSALDNAMFAVNYLTVFPGLGLAVVAGGFTVQVEATLLQLTQVRGQEPLDDSNTNFTTGLHAGYFVFPFLSVGAELRHQRWITTPAAVGADPGRATRDNTTLAFGPRVHVRVGEAVLRPGVALVLPLDDVMADAEYKIVQLDLPLTF